MASKVKPITEEKTGAKRLIALWMSKGTVVEAVSVKLQVMSLPAPPGYFIVRDKSEKNMSGNRTNCQVVWEKHHSGNVPEASEDQVAELREGVRGLVGR